jgi:hypothetical protein
MNRGLLVYVIIASVFLFVIILQVAFTRYSVGRLERLKESVDFINADLKVLSIEVRLMDSILVKNIEGSYRKIEELTEIRKMTQKQIDSLHDVILDDIKGIEDLKDDLLRW